MKKLSVRQIAFIGLMAALVYAVSAIPSFPIPLPIGETRIHPGNAICLLSGMLLGPFAGGMAAGIGSMFFDLTNPAYIASAPFTLVFKFMMAFVCAWIVRGGKEKVWSLIVGAVVGAATYMALYLGKGFVENYFVLQQPLEASLIILGTKAMASSVNAVLAVVLSVPLHLLMKPLLKRAKLL
jgi:uncharacterized membrane protein